LKKGRSAEIRIENFVDVLEQASTQA